MLSHSHLPTTAPNCLFTTSVFPRGDLLPSESDFWLVSKRKFQSEKKTQNTTPKRLRTLREVSEDESPSSTRTQQPSLAPGPCWRHGVWVSGPLHPWTRRQGQRMRSWVRTGASRRALGDAAGRGRAPNPSPRAPQAGRGPKLAYRLHLNTSFVASAG